LGLFVERGQVKSDQLFGALKLYERGCQGGNELGCTHAKRVLQDTARRATAGCKRNDAMSCFIIGSMRQEGQGAAKDLREAAGLYDKACKAGSLEGCSALASLYKNGEGVVRDRGLARRLWEQACSGGYAGGCGNLAILNIDEGEVAKGVELFRRACAAGEGVSCTNLARMHRSGQGLSPNPALETDLIHQGCQKGDREACALPSMD
jgi:TPR repeat protein